jgi:hypothetical protein
MKKQKSPVKAVKTAKAVLSGKARASKIDEMEMQALGIKPKPKKNK